MDIQTALQPLLRHPSSPPLEIEHIRARAQRRRTRRRALSTAAVGVILVAAALPAWALTRPDHAAGVTTSNTGQGGSEPPQPTTTTFDRCAGLAPRPDETTSVAPSSLTLDPTPPWSAPPRAASEAPTFIEAWNSDPYARECPALAPDDLGDGAGATARVTTRGQPGAWWVEYDLPGAPGEVEPQFPAVDAGRATFFVSATIGEPGYEFTISEEAISRWPNVHHWSDGSSVGWGVMGGGTFEESEPEWPTAWLAYMELEG